MGATTVDIFLIFHTFLIFRANKMVDEESPGRSNGDKEEGEERLRTAVRMPWSVLVSYPHVRELFSYTSVCQRHHVYETLLLAVHI